ncbi:hypothetical protein F1536_27445 [Achromobacter xylosoxidans]|uniref:hemagglutinin repeat-containing protein n=1 Tax=Alcaligenes xylosoxydans xylosoxydans TaxID=85698 RepID=UPI001231BF5F|nr:hemagglutinin repeat-containing protein [Achromobacter xylosoxidans]KAA5919637.1 hypothetical protein F1536_27445 [Achromobacter xylosoxidans]MBK1977270.1 hemagglutinin repeat-containing protein [Achromobacter xylosoxidans]MCZ8383230.1 hemagglutinin repeat-containing protein [Achromobacter xylosoxidans]QKI70614.1 hypothetical protein HPS44_13765 [Achromobacter xylosoxidans]
MHHRYELVRQIKQFNRQSGWCVSIKLSLGASKSHSTTDRNASTAFGSTAAAGHDLTIIATGAGRDSDINLTGSNLSAGNSAVLKAEGGILL